MAKKKKHEVRSIITGYLEKIGSEVFEDYYKNAVTKMIKGCQGVYALYKNDSLYYVGLAIEFKRRIKQHLSDKHAGKWNKFSLFIIRKEEHIKELESLIVHVAKPKGNSQSGKFRNAKNLRPELNETVDELYRDHIKKMFGGGTKAQKKHKPKTLKRMNTNRERPLQGYFQGGKVIYADYKGKEYKAWVYRNGKIKLDSKFFDNPSMAGSFIRSGKSTNGWRFWKYKNKNGEFVYIDELRK